MKKTKEFQVGKARFAKVTTSSFFGHFLYDQIIPPNHFVRQAKKMIDWEKFTNTCLHWYRGSGQTGRPPHNPAVMLRMLFAFYLYNISERQTEEAVNYNLALKYFVGLGVDQAAPDHSSLTVFKERLIFGGGQKAYDALLKEILTQAAKQGIQFGQVQVVDSVHTLANVNFDKDQRRQKGGRLPRDPDARWGAKGHKKIKDEKGQIKKVTDYFNGYKSHVSLNAQSRLITAVKTTAGNRHDGQEFRTVLQKDEKLKSVLPQKRTYAADRAYDDGDNHFLLKTKQLNDAICLNDYRTKKKNPNKEPWLKLKNSPTYQTALKERYKIEQVFGLKKQSHGLRRCRYLGAVKFNLQAHLTAIVYNLTVVAACLTGYTLRGYAQNGYVWHSALPT